MAVGMSFITLVANPGSASRKYALYDHTRLLASLHFEHEEGRLICTLVHADRTVRLTPDIADIAESGDRVLSLLHDHHILAPEQVITRVGLRIVAPTSFFLGDHVLDEPCIKVLQTMYDRVPLHVASVLQEYQTFRRCLPGTPIVGVSDSAFHATKPDYAWNYGLPLADSDRLELKRFGYHGLSAAAVVRQLHAASKLPPRVVMCHLGSGASVTALWHGKSRDTTMGYSPLEGLIMATRSGSVDASLVPVLRRELQLDDEGLEVYLNERSGLLGLSGSSSDVRILLQREAEGDHYAHLALETYIYTVQKAIGQMSASLGGIDLLVFTGTVGERSPAMRKRLLQAFHYLDFSLDEHANEACVAPERLSCISRLAHSRPVYVVPADEAGEIVRRTVQKDI